MCGVVYLILNKINGRKYVGQTVHSLKRRFKDHACSEYYIGNAIRKYGRENFYCGVIKTCASKAELDYWEKYFIAALHCKVPYGYNLTDGGEGTVGYHPTPETLAKQSAARKGKPHSPEWCAKIAVALAGKPKSPEHRAKMSKPKSPEHVAKFAAAFRKYTPFKNLLREIDERQLTYTALGEILGVCQTAVTRKMRGERNFTESDRVKLEEFFGKPADYLLERNS